MSGFVYILQSEMNQMYYIGSTKDLEVRLKQHNSGQVTATKNKRPYQLVFHQQFESYEQAQRVERKLKSWKRKDWLTKIIQDGYIRGPVAQW